MGNLKIFLSNIIDHLKYNDTAYTVMYVLLVFPSPKFVAPQSTLHVSENGGN